MSTTSGMRCAGSIGSARALVRSVSPDIVMSHQGENADHARRVGKPGVADRDQQ
jgi:hypothetical protein